MLVKYSGHIYIINIPDEFQLRCFYQKYLQGLLWWCEILLCNMRVVPHFVNVYKKYNFRYIKITMGHSKSITSKEDIVKLLKWLEYNIRNCAKDRTVIKETTENKFKYS